MLSNSVIYTKLLENNGMSAELELRWLKTESLRGAVRRFAEFCKEDIHEQAKQEDFDLDKYQEGVKLVLQKLDNSLSLEEMFNAELAAEETANAD